MNKSENCKNTKYRLLRLVLWTATFGWGISIIAVFLPWNIAETALEGLGSNPIPPDPMLNYWLRMATGAFSIIGILFGVTAFNPKKYAVLLPVLGWLSTSEGILLFIYGLKLGLKPLPFYGDCGFCLITGIGVLILKNSIE